MLIFNIIVKEENKKKGVGKLFIIKHFQYVLYVYMVAK